MLFKDTFYFLKIETDSFPNHNFPIPVLHVTLPCRGGLNKEIRLFEQGRIIKMCLHRRVHY